MAGCQTARAYEKRTTGQQPRNTVGYFFIIYLFIISESDADTPFRDEITLGRVTGIGPTL